MWDKKTMSVLVLEVSHKELCEIQNIESRNKNIKLFMPT